MKIYHDRYRMPWGLDEEAVLVRFVERRYPTHLIGEYMGRTRSAVRQRKSRTMKKVRKGYSFPENAVSAIPYIPPFDREW